MQENIKLETDVLIIGAGPVGIFAAFQAGLLGMKSVVIDALEEVGGQLTTLYPNKYIYDIPGFPKILAKDLIANLYEQAEKYKPIYLLNQKAESLVKSVNSFTVTTSKNNTITSKAIILAGGAGAFKPQRLPLQGMEEFEKETILYNIKDPSYFASKNVLIVGGGDSALDWSFHLSNNIANKVYLVHRRNHFRALPSSVSSLEELSKSSSFELVVPYGVKAVEGEGTKVQKVVLENFLNKEQKTINIDFILPFFGLSRDLGGVSSWGLDIDKINSTIIVNPETFETNINGIFATGDIAKYDHKLKLIMTGFSEVAYALHIAWKYVFPDKVFHFSHSTSKN